MLNYMPQVGSVGASLGVLHSVPVSLSDKYENGNEHHYCTGWCRIGTLG